MADYLELEDVKKHLRVDFDDDNDYIENLCAMVEQLVAIEIEDDLTNLEIEGDLPLQLKHAMLLMIGHFYMIREPIIIGTIVAKIPYAFEFLIAPFKNFTIA